MSRRLGIGANCVAPEIKPADACVMDLIERMEN